MIYLYRLVLSTMPRKVVRKIIFRVLSIILCITATIVFAVSCSISAFADNSYDWLNMYYIPEPMVTGDNVSTMRLAFVDNTDGFNRVFIIEAYAVPQLASGQNWYGMTIGLGINRVVSQTDLLINNFTITFVDNRYVDTNIDTPIVNVDFYFRTMYYTSNNGIVDVNDFQKIGTFSGDDTPLTQSFDFTEYDFLSPSNLKYAEFINTTPITQYTYNLIQSWSGGTTTTTRPYISAHLYQNSAFTSDIATIKNEQLQGSIYATIQNIESLLEDDGIEEVSPDVANKNDSLSSQIENNQSVLVEADLSSVNDLPINNNALSPFLSPILYDNTVIIPVLVITLTIAFVSYILFGKKS